MEELAFERIGSDESSRKYNDNVLKSLLIHLPQESGLNWSSLLVRNPNESDDDHTTASEAEAEAEYYSDDDKSYPSEQSAILPGISLTSTFSSEKQVSFEPQPLYQHQQQLPFKRYHQLQQSVHDLHPHSVPMVKTHATATTHSTGAATTTTSQMLQQEGPCVMQYQQPPEPTNTDIATVLGALIERMDGRFSEARKRQESEWERLHKVLQEDARKLNIQQERYQQQIVSQNETISAMQIRLSKLETQLQLAQQQTHVFPAPATAVPATESPSFQPAIAMGRSPDRLVAPSPELTTVSMDRIPPRSTGTPSFTGPHETPSIVDQAESEETNSDDEDDDDDEVTAARNSLSITSSSTSDPTPPAEDIALTSIGVVSLSSAVTHDAALQSSPETSHEDDLIFSSSTNSNPSLTTAAFFSPTPRTSNSSHGSSSNNNSLKLLTQQPLNDTSKLHYQQQNLQLLSSMRAVQSNVIESDKSRSGPTKVTGRMDTCMTTLLPSKPISNKYDQKDLPYLRRISQSPIELADDGSTGSKHSHKSQRSTESLGRQIPSLPLPIPSSSSQLSSRHTFMVSTPPSRSLNLSCGSCDNTTSSVLDSPSVGTFPVQRNDEERGEQPSQRSENTESAAIEPREGVSAFDFLNAVTPRHANTAGLSTTNHPVYLMQHVPPGTMDAAREEAIATALIQKWQDQHEARVRTIQQKRYQMGIAMDRAMKETRS